MADSGLFISWGKPVPGRELDAAKLFKEAADQWTKLQRSGDIESFEIASLEPHAGNINDFILLRGDLEQLAKLRVSDEFMTLSERANGVLWDFRIAGALLGARAWGKIERFEQAAEKWAGQGGGQQG